MNALEATAFMITDSVSSIGEEPLAYNSVISIRGEDQIMSIILSATGGFLEELASSMLGVDPSEIDEQIEGPQALSEFANILGGEVVMALGGAERSFTLSLPQPADHMPSKTLTACELDSMGERFRVAIA